MVFCFSVIGSCGQMKNETLFRKSSSSPVKAAFSRQLGNISKANYSWFQCEVWRRIPLDVAVIWKLTNQGDASMPSKRGNIMWRAARTQLQPACSQTRCRTWSVGSRLNSMRVFFNDLFRPTLWKTKEGIHTMLDALAACPCKLPFPAQDGLSQIIPSSILTSLSNLKIYG